MDRQRVLRQGNRKFVFIPEEAVLCYRLTSTVEHAEQLAHLMEIMKFPSVSIGVIPLTVDREYVRPIEGFVIFGDEQVSIELLSGYLKITQPKEIAMYSKEFAALASVAVYGHGARNLITAAQEALPL
ncbi:Scr1 family TA system antitoxin-like transcriptional regulator [Streptosporangium sp. NPDC000509]|uniref:Scr1 family TA system antitoxin-like transcriptional regulator n=1 Tax=Streptosporangium sp. NPDC000509 TaxID=3366186 RepID=UPI0036C963CF